MARDGKGTFLIEGTALLGKKQDCLKITVVERLGMKHFVLEASVVSAASGAAF